MFGITREASPECFELEWLGKQFTGERMTTVGQWESIPRLESAKRILKKSHGDKLEIRLGNSMDEHFDGQEGAFSVVKMLIPTGHRLKGNRERGDRHYLEPDLAILRALFIAGLSTQWWADYIHAKDLHTKETFKIRYESYFITQPRLKFLEGIEARDELPEELLNIREQLFDVGRPWLSQDRKLGFDFFDVPRWGEVFDKKQPEFSVALNINSKTCSGNVDIKTLTNRRDEMAKDICSAMERLGYKVDMLTGNWKIKYFHRLLGKTTVTKELKELLQCDDEFKDGTDTMSFQLRT